MRIQEWFSPLERAHNLLKISHFPLRSPNLVLGHIFEHHKRSGTADKIKKFRQDPLGDLCSPRPCTNPLGNPSPYSLLYNVMVQPILSSTQSPESVPPSIVERKRDNSLAPPAPLEYVFWISIHPRPFLYTQGCGPIQEWNA